MKRIYFLLILLINIKSLKNKYIKICSKNEECLNFGKSYLCLENQCIHEKIKFNNKKYILGLFILLFINLLSSIAGMGSGTLIVPILLLLFNFSIVHAIPFSKFIILISSIFNSFFIIKLKHNNTFVLNYNILIFSIPFLLLGTIVGVMINNLLSDLTITSLLFLILVFCTLMILINIFKIKKSKEIKTNILEVNNIEDDLNNKIKPKYCLLLNFLSLYIILFLTYIEKYFKNLNYFYFSIKIFISLIYGFFNCFYKYKITKSFNKIDIKILIINLLSGIASGTLGLGGSTILTPFFINLNYSPLLTSCITGYSIFFSSASTSYQYYLLGAIDIKIIIYLVIFSLMGTIIGRIFLKNKIKNSNIMNIILLIIFFLFLSSTIIIFFDFLYLAKNNNLK